MSDANQNVDPPVPAGSSQEGTNPPANLPSGSENPPALESSTEGNSGEDQNLGGGGEDDQHAGSAVKKPIQPRINELVRKQREAEREAAYWRGIAEASRAPAAAHAPAPVRAANDTPRVPKSSAASFVEQHTEAARKVEQQTGIPASFMLAQSALETGWGGKEIVGRDGTPSNNLFGIKAGSSWNGRTVDVMTTEYVDGKPQKMVQKFRAYASHQESFADYARLISENPRYADAMKSVGNAKAFARGLQNGGYATDPQYAVKLAKVIDTTHRLQKDMA